MAVRAPASWAAELAPRAAVSWFVASSDALGEAGCGLPELLERAARTYPAMAEPVERVSEEGWGLSVWLRPMELSGEDLGALGVADAMAALARRSQVCGMRLVASMNACAGLDAVHGMPLPDRPEDGEPRLVAMLAMLGGEGLEPPR